MQSGGRLRRGAVQRALTDKKRCGAQRLRAEQPQAGARKVCLHALFCQQKHLQVVFQRVRLKALTLAQRQPFLVGCEDLFPAGCNSLDQMLLVYRLEQIAERAVADGVLRIGKFAVRAQKDDLARNLCFADRTQQRDPVRAGHFDVCQENIRAEFPQKRQNLIAASCERADLDPVLFQVDELADALAQQPVVVRDKHFQHAGSPPSQFSGISKQTAVPTPSFVRICRPFVILK